MRVTLREVHETAFRALVAAGGDAGEAAAAAEQVLHAELLHGIGVSGLVRELDAGPWPRRGLSGTPLALDGWTGLAVDCTGRPGPLRWATLLADLAAASPPGTAIVATGTTGLDALVDHALLRAAVANGTAVAAIDVRRQLVRAATPDGAVGTLARLDGAALPPVAGIVLVRPQRLDRTTAGSWFTRDEIRDRRRAAARTGLEVDSALWQHAYRVSRGYLVPES